MIYQNNEKNYNFSAEDVDIYSDDSSDYCYYSAFKSMRLSYTKIDFRMNNAHIYSTLPLWKPYYPLDTYPIHPKAG